MANIFTKENLTTNQYIVALSNAKTIEFWRKNPVIACRDLIGITLLDFQSALLTEMWIAKDIAICTSRNAGKTSLAAIFILLTALLYPEQEIFLVSKAGSQSKLLFMNMEKIALAKISSYGQLPDTFSLEVSRANDSITGFSHSPGGFEVTLLNGSTIKSLNGIPDNVRGYRASLLCLDEAGFITDELFAAVEPFTTTDKTFQTSTDVNFDIRTIPRNKQNTRLYISSASATDTHFYKVYKNLALRMFAGDSRYFAASIPVDIPLAPTLKGVKYPPLLNYAQVEADMASNPTKALREYYCKFDNDGGNSQICKSHTIAKNSTFLLPRLVPTKGRRYLLGYDSAHIADNSIFGVLETYEEEGMGLCGDLINMINFKALGEIGNRQMLYQDQMSAVREYIVRYNGEDNAEYENIHKLAIDAGTGGGGLIYGHVLMFDWKDSRGITHRGVIDKSNTSDSIQRDYPNAYNIINLVEPTKWKNTIIERTIELLDLGVIRFPKEYNGSGTVDIEDDSEDGITRKTLSKEEILALTNIDLLKEELKMIHRFVNGERVTYGLRKDVKHKMHDDRFYVLCLLGNELYELREKNRMKQNKSKKEKDRTILGLFN